MGCASVQERNAKYLYIDGVLTDVSAVSDDELKLLKEIGTKYQIDSIIYMVNESSTTAKE